MAIGHDFNICGLSIWMTLKVGNDGKLLYITINFLLLLTIVVVKHFWASSRVELDLLCS